MKNRLVKIAIIVIPIAALIALAFALLSFFMADISMITAVKGLDAGTTEGSAPWPPKVSAKKYGLHLIEETLPATFTANSINVKIDRRFIKYPQTLPILAVKPIDQSKDFGWFGATAVSDRHKIGTTTRRPSAPNAPVVSEVNWYLKGMEEGTLTVNDFGGVRFTKKPPANPEPPQNEKDPIGLSKKLAGQYLRSHGGFPKDAQVDRAFEIVDYGTLPEGPALSAQGQKTTQSPGTPLRRLGYEVIYKHTYKGVPIFDDEIRVDINQDVRLFERRWHYFKPSDECQIISPRIAIENILKADKGRMKRQRLVRPYNMHLIYFEPLSHGARQTHYKNLVLRPGWIIGVSNDGDHLVDAQTGELLTMMPYYTQNYSPDSMYEFE